MSLLVLFNGPLDIPDGPPPPVVAAFGRGDGQVLAAGGARTTITMEYGGVADVYRSGGGRGSME